LIVAKYKKPLASDLSIERFFFVYSTLHASFFLSLAQYNQRVYTTLSDDSRSSFNIGKSVIPKTSALIDFDILGKKNYTGT
jgi:hypothetical protein